MRQHTRHTLYDAANTIYVEAKQHNFHCASTEGMGNRNPHQDMPGMRKSMKWVFV